MNDSILTPTICRNPTPRHCFANRSIQVPIGNRCRCFPDLYLIPGLAKHDALRRDFFRNGRVHGICGIFNTLGATYVQQVGCFLLPGFSMGALDRIIEPLWAANLGQFVHRYEWFVISPDGSSVSTDRGLVISPDEAIDAGRDFSRILLISSPQSKDISAPNVTPWLRSLGHTGCRLGAIGDATLLLARAGLLDGYRCAVPEPLQQAFAVEFPDVRICRDPFCLVPERVTCTGVAAVVDMMLAIYK